MNCGKNVFGDTYTLRHHLQYSSLRVIRIGVRKYGRIKKKSWALVGQGQQRCFSLTEAEHREIVTRITNERERKNKETRRASLCYLFPVCLLSISGRPLDTSARSFLLHPSMDNILLSLFLLFDNSFFRREGRIPLRFSLCHIFMLYAVLVWRLNRRGIFPSSSSLLGETTSSR